MFIVHEEQANRRAPFAKRLWCDGVTSEVIVYSSDVFCNVKINSN